MDRSIVLCHNIHASREALIAILSSTEGQRAFWTSDCEVDAGRARFGFDGAPADLEAEVTVEPQRAVRMRVTAGFPYWVGSVWEWELGDSGEEDSVQVLFRHHGFTDGYAETDLGYTAQTWALILERLKRLAEGGPAQPYFT